ncbi:MAG: YidH family protein [Rhizomicrobium sp.]
MSEFQAAQRFDVPPNVGNHFAWMRTRLGIERTYLAWIRTGVSLIGFGFTIVQFFQKLQGMTARNGRTMAEDMPRNLGLALIAAGVLSLAISSFQYRAQLRYLWTDQFRAIAGVSEKPHRTPAFISAMVLLLIGIAAFVSVFFRFL